MVICNPENWIQIPLQPFPHQMWISWCRNHCILHVYTYYQAVDA